jgi:hypothetical protein
MSDDLSETGGFEPKRYMGYFLEAQLPEKPARAEWKLVEKAGIYDVYETDIPFYFYLIDEENGHYFLARQELYNDAQTMEN